MIPVDLTAYTNERVPIDVKWDSGRHGLLTMNRTVHRHIVPVRVFTIAVVGVPVQ